MRRPGILRRHAAQPATLIAVLLTAACAGSAGQSTRLTRSDLDVVTEEMRARLAASDFLRDRSPGSPAIRVVIDKVENRTSDLMPESEQWMLMARIQGSLPLRQLQQQKNITFLITAQQHQRLRDAGLATSLEAPEQPTHAMSAVFRSSTRAERERGQALSRLDRYTLCYEIHDLTSRAKVWNEEFEFARRAEGRAVD